VKRSAYIQKKNKMKSFSSGTLRPLQHSNVFFFLGTTLQTYLFFICWWRVENFETPHKHSRIENCKVTTPKKKERLLACVRRLMFRNITAPEPIDPATLSVQNRNVTKKGFATMDLLRNGKKMVLEIEGIELYINQFKSDHGEGSKVIFSWKPSEEWLNFFLELEATVKTFAASNKDKVFDNAYFPNASIDKNFNAIVADAKVDPKTGVSYRRGVNLKGSTDRSGACNTKVTNFNDEDRTVEAYFKTKLIASVLVELGPLYTMAGNSSAPQTFFLIPFYALSLYLAFS